MKQYSEYLIVWQKGMALVRKFYQRIARLFNTCFLVVDFALVRRLGAMFLLTSCFSLLSLPVYGSGPNFNDTDNKTVSSISPAFSGTVTLPGGVWSSAGNVGIGSATPQAKLEVEGSVYVGSGGNIGIGTAEPAAGFQVGTGTSALSATLDGMAALIKGNLEVDGKLYGDGSRLTNLPSSQWNINGSSLYYNSGNVGIGSSSPVTKFTVNNSTGSVSDTIVAINGPAAFSGSWLDLKTAGTSSLLITNSWNVDHYEPTFYSANTDLTQAALQFRNGNGFLRILPYGNNTVYFQSSLSNFAFSQLNGDQGTTLYFNFANTIVPSHLAFGDVSGSGEYLTSDRTGAGGSQYDLEFYTNSLRRMTILNDGNLGIGSTNPQAKLDVEGTVYFGTGNVGIGTATPYNTLSVFGPTVSGPSDFYPVRISANVSTPGGVGLMIDNTNGPSDMNAFFDFASEGTAKWSAGMDVNANGTNDFFIYDHASTATRFYINSSGNVGIGTTAPVGLLDVSHQMVVLSGGNVGIGSVTPQQKLDVEGAVYFGTGNVGIGTASPLTKLQVTDTASSSPRGILSSQISSDINGARVGFSKARGAAGALTIIVTGDTIGRLMFRGYDGSNYLEMASIEAVSTGTVASTRVPTYMAFSTGTDAAPSVLTERLRIDSAGNVGIGSTTPLQKLDVEGTIYIGNGNLGIGSSAPSSKLVVNNTFAYQSMYNNPDSGTSATINWNNGNLQKIRMTGNCTFTFVAPGTPARLALELVQDSTGSRTATFSGVKWPGGTAPTLTTTATTGTDLISCLYDGTNYLCTASLDLR